MAAPRHVPVAPLERTRSYTSPDAVPGAWRAARRAELGARQPSGGTMGHQGPDQGYALRLCRVFADRLHLVAGEDRHDVERGCVQIALKRASMFGRGPVVHDLEIAYRLWGYLDEDPDAALVAARRPRFEGVAERHHYADARSLVASVPNEVLALSPAEVERRHAQGWAELLEID
ncbi:MAG: hypothetical protein P8N02_11660 [Actinomycetota bacterium]|nr:hypothetical protein [Actinomycetota bacterium]